MDIVTTDRETGELIYTTAKAVPTAWSNASAISELKLQVELLEQTVTNLREELEDVTFTVNDALLRLLPAVQVVNVELPAPQQQSEEEYTKQRARYLQAQAQETVIRNIREAHEVRMYGANR